MYREVSNYFKSLGSIFFYTKLWDVLKEEVYEMFN